MTEHIPPKYDLSKINHVVQDGNVFLSAADLDTALKDIINAYDTYSRLLLETYGLSGVTYANTYYLMGTNAVALKSDIKNFADQVLFEATTKGFEE